MTKEKIANICIIGGGIAGLTAASLAVDAGYRVILFEKNELGGKAFNGGDIYLNAFFQKIKQKQNLRRQDLFAAFKEQGESKREQLNHFFPCLTKNENLIIINQEAETIDNQRVKSGGKTYFFEKLIIAAGIKQNIPEIEGLAASLASKDTLFATEFSHMKPSARKIAILGGGRIAIEIAMILMEFNFEVHVYSRSLILNHLDQEVREKYLKDISNKLLHLHPFNLPIKIEKNKLYFKDKVKKFDNIILASGNYFNSDLAEKLNLETNENGIIVNNYMQSSIPNVYAIGDVNMNNKFSNIASNEAVIAINHIRGFRMNYKNEFFYRILGKLEYAYFGLSEQELIAKNITYKRFRIKKDEINENYERIHFVKLLFDEFTREIYGIFIIAEDAYLVMNSILLLLEETIDDRVNSRLSLFSNTYFVARLIKNQFKEKDQQIIDEHYQPFYQIKVDKDKKIIGAESLARFKVGDKFLSPLPFIKNFEKNGMIVQLDLKTVEAGCKLMAELKGQNLIDESFHLSINLSSLTIDTLEYEEIIKQLELYQIDQKSIIFEITERQTYEDDLTYLQKLKNFKSLGLMLSMDDFSVGNSSLNLFDGASFDEVKLDMSLLPESEDDFGKISIYRKLTELLREKDLKLVSEGIENEFNYQFVKSLGIDYFQGYYFSKPLSQTDFVGLLKTNK